MIIKFTCKNCNNVFEKSEDELIAQAQSFRHCAICGQKLSISNLTEIFDEDIKDRVKTYTDNALKSLGIEGAIEAIEHLQNETIRNLYQTELRKRGIIK